MVMTNRGGLLPGRIPPQTIPLVEEAPTGELITNINWYLYFYNIGQQVLSSTTAVAFPPAVNIPLQDIDIAATDTSQAYRLIANAVLQLSEQDSGPTVRDVANALLAGLDGLSQDTAARAQPSASVTVTASPFTYTANFAGSVAISGGTVSLVSVIRQGVAVATGVVAGVIPVSRLDQVQITYTVAPVVVFLPT